MRAFYAARFPAGRWIDKTPGLISGGAFMLAAFPDAGVVVTRRTGVEVVASHMRRFGETLPVACRKWRRSMEGLVALRRQPSASILEQDQFDLANAPEPSAARSAAHLGAPEKAAELGRLFLHRHVERSSAHDWTQRLTLAESGWTDEQKGVFVAECGPMMAALGYPM